MAGFLCGQCGLSSRDGARFCDGCGARLLAVTALAAPEPPDEELKHVTVLFGDVVASTEIIAGLSPEEARRRLTPAIDTMCEAVLAFGGTLNQTQGDGIMALFGAPQSMEDHALRACCAALQMHQFAAQLRPPTRLRAGLASGLTILSAGGGTGAVGAFLAFGATIHLASRLQHLAAAGATLCSGEAVRLAGSSVVSAALGEHAIRGLPEREEVFELLGVSRSSLRFNGAVARGLSPYVGRDVELAELQRAADLAQAGQTALRAVVGEAGIGKSRLVWEFARSLNLLVWQVYRAEAVSYGRTIPYMLAAALLRACLDVDDRVPPAEAAARVMAQIEQLGGLPPRLQTALLSLLVLPTDAGAAEWDALEPPQRRAALRDSVVQLLQMLTRERPLLLLLEDLHWADEQSLRLLDLAAANTSRLLLLATYRAGFDPGWTVADAAIIPVGPLPAKSMQQLAEAACPSTIDATVRQELLQRAAGNPFFLEEMARAAADAQRATARIGRPGAAVPATVQAVLAARIDRLAAADKHLLTAASALGNRFSAGTLRALFADQPGASFQCQMNRLAEAGLLREDRAGDGEYGFVHALIQEVAYAGLPAARRRSLHADIVHAIQQVFAGRLPEQAERLAYHGQLGEMWDEVAVQARLAGQRAASRSAYADAVAFFEQAIAACERLPGSDETLATRIDLRFDLRNALFPTSAIGQGLMHSQEAERLAQQLGDWRRLAWATAFVARDLTLKGRQREAIATAERAQAIAGDDDELSVTIGFYRGLADYFRGGYAAANATLREAVRRVEAGDRLRRYGLPAPATLYLRAWLAWGLARMGRTGEAEHVVAGMREVAAEYNQPLADLVTVLSEGVVHAFAGRLGEAEARLQQSLALCRRWEFYSWFTNIARTLGYVLHGLGRAEQAVELLTECVRRSRDGAVLVGLSNELAWLAEAQLAAGHLDRALATAAEAVELARVHEERGNEALACFAQAAALAASGATALSQEAYQAAALLAEACGMEPLLARCREKRLLGVCGPA